MSDTRGMGAGCADILSRPGPGPVTIVVFGASGDLSHRKIFPALHSLFSAGLLDPGSRVVGVSRRPLSDEAFRDGLRTACELRSRAWDGGANWDEFARIASYLGGDIEAEDTYSRLAAYLDTRFPPDLLFYLAVAPGQFAGAVAGLAKAGFGTAGKAAGLEEGGEGGSRGPWRRLVVEKPFGVDRRSARELNRILAAAFDEADVFRIDHYLGKEAVQNLIYFRFANSIFEPLWNRRYIDRVEIDVFETQGIGSRGGYYDRAGQARDMVQNHLVQLLCLAAMEPPPSLDPEAIRDEKVKVLRSIPRWGERTWLERSRRGQYSRGAAPDGTPVPDYLEEGQVGPGSTTETFVQLRLEVDNWRFAGVPFVLRTGKAMDRTMSEIRVRFKRPPETLFAGICADSLPTNGLHIRIQPDEGIWLDFNAKEPGTTGIERNQLRFSYGGPGSRTLPEAYERLLADALAGDSTLFIRADEAEEAWRVVDGLEAAWASAAAPPLLRYAAGSSPDEAPLADGA